MKLKNEPIIDVCILIMGFILRIILGGMIINVVIPQWLYLIIIAGALFMSLGKRRNELTQHNNTRAVLNKYSESFLEINMYACFTLVIVFYSLWALESEKNDDLYCSLVTHYNDAIKYVSRK